MVLTGRFTKIRQRKLFTSRGVQEGRLCYLREQQIDNHPEMLHLTKKISSLPVEALDTCRVGEKASFNASPATPWGQS
jgi:hypothetical protein